MKKLALVALTALFSVGLVAADMPKMDKKDGMMESKKEIKEEMKEMKDDMKKEMKDDMKDMKKDMKDDMKKGM